MSGRIKGALPLAVVIGVLAFVACEIGFNFTFHWFTDGDLGNGLSLPKNFHLVVPAAFVSWGFFFAAGADTAAFVKVAVASVTGSLAALVTMVLSAGTADLPDFWAISLWVGVLATILVLMTALGDWHYVPAAFGAFACVFFWWTATGLDRWAPDGGGIGNSVKALADPTTAGAGAFGGVISTPAVGVWASVAVTLLIGCVLGLVSVKLTALVSPATAEVGEDEVVDAPRR